MNVATLRELLAPMDGSARVLLYAPSNPSMDGQPLGHLLHLAITRLDGAENTVTLSTCQNTADPEAGLVFDGEATVNVASASTRDGLAAAQASLHEQLTGKRAMSVSDHLEVQRVRAAFQRLNALIEGGGKADA